MQVQLMIINIDGKFFWLFALQTTNSKTVEVDDNQIGCSVVHKLKILQLKGCLVLSVSPLTIFNILLFNVVILFRFSFFAILLLSLGANNHELYLIW